MVKIELQNYDTGSDPAPRYATDAEIALAEQLRHQLEERYFGSSFARPQPQPQQDEVH